jgi:hypothetical protein
LGLKLVPAPPLQRAGADGRHDPPGRLTDNLELLRLAQSSLSGLSFRDFCLKAKVGPTQFKSQSRGIG